MNASGAALEMLQAMLSDPSSLDTIVADLGPGSFTGSKVGVTIAKTLGYSLKCRTFGVTSFDLVCCQSTIFIPSRKGEFFVRVVGEEPIVTKSVPADGFGYGCPEMETIYPKAENFCPSCTAVEFAPEALVPLYIAPPSISIPKDPRTLRGSGG